MLLDLAIHYLRCVHQISYYAGKGCESKGDLWSVSPSIVCRPFMLKDIPYEYEERVVNSLEKQGMDQDDEHVMHQEEENEETKKEATQRKTGLFDLMLIALKRRGEQKCYWHKLLKGESMPQEFLKEGKEGGDSSQGKVELPFALTSAFYKKVLTVQENMHVEAQRMRNMWIEERTGKEEGQGGEDGEETYVRCLISKCFKLFKKTSFLHKHMENKHKPFLEFGTVFPPLIRSMRHLYRLTPALQKPFPSVRIEKQGSVDVDEMGHKSNNTTMVPFIEFYQQVHPQEGGKTITASSSKKPNFSMSFSDFMAQQHQQRAGGAGEYQDRIRDEDEDGSGSFVRKPLFTYEDMDKPKIEKQSTSFNFGVSVAPQKKKRRLFKKK
jgi:hypothetical protein